MNKIFVVCDAMPSGEAVVASEVNWSKETTLNEL